MSNLKKQNRNFGLLVGSVLLVIGIYRLMIGYWVIGLLSYWLFGMGLSLIIPALFFPSVLTYFRLAWEKLGHVLGIINSYILLTILFVFVFTPLGLIMRLLRKDPLKIRWKNKSETYWEEAETPTPLNRQF